MFVANSVIENLLQLKKPQAAMTLDALFAADLQAWPSMDVSTILHYLSLSGIAIGESIVRKGLFDLSRLGLLTAKKIMSRAKGRPAWAYRINTVKDMASKLGVKLHVNEAADAIPLTSFKSARAYRGAKHYGLLKRLGTSFLSRKKLGARLGVGGRSTFNYEQGMNIQVIPRYDTVKMSMADVPAAPTKRINANVFLLVEFVRELTDLEFAEKYKEYDPATAIFWKRTVTDERKMPYTAFILKRELERGNTVYKRKQISNEYQAA